MANIMCTRIVILLAAAGLSLAGAAGTAFADPRPGYSDGYGYDKNGAYNDGMGYDKNGVFDDGQGYADGNGDDDNSSSSFNCFDNGGYDADGTANCGWYDGFFYPGFGNFVFDRDHHRHEMSGHQHDYFTRQARGPDGGRDMPDNGMGLGSSGPRNGFGGGSLGGFGEGFGGSHDGMSGRFHGGGGHRG